MKKKKNANALSHNNEKYLWPEEHRLSSKKNSKCINFRALLISYNG